MATDLGCLSGLKNITTLKLEACPALTSLQGLQGCTGLKGLSLSKCSSLTDLSVLSGMSELALTPRGTVYGDDSLRLDPGRGLSDLRFVTGLKAAKRLELRLSPKADTTPFLESPWITEVQLTLESWNVDLSSFRHCSSLDVRCSDKQGTHRWAYDLPALTTLKVMGGHHQFDALQAPRMASFVADDLDPEGVLIVQDNEPYSKGLGDAVFQQLASRDIDSS
jgi:hypothetical protein